jgi:uncharacterized protein YdhG (YjbR/CyaY superfamily)
MAKKPKPSGRTRAPAASVDEYLAALPQDVRAALAKLRRTIKAAAPMATEGISYRIPAYKHHGLLVGFAAMPNHCTFHVMSPAVMRAHAATVKQYPIGKGSIRFSAAQPLPAAPVATLVKARIAENEKRSS